VEKMIESANNREVLIGILHDEIFGPILTFGAGGTYVEIIHDRAVELPPLSSLLAKQMIEKTRIAKALSRWRSMPAVNMNALIDVLLRVSEMACFLPEIYEMDINPIIANEKEIIAVDARIGIRAYSCKQAYAHLAIHPYPIEFSIDETLRDGSKLSIRPLKPEDAVALNKLINSLSPSSKHLRFMKYFQEVTPSMLVRFTQLDYDREMALLAFSNKNDSKIPVGFAHYAAFSDGLRCEFGLFVADTWQQKGVGAKLLTRLIKIARSKQLKEMIGYVLAENIRMLDLAKFLGFSINQTDDPKVYKIAQGLEP